MGHQAYAFSTEQNIQHPIRNYFLQISHARQRERRTSLDF